MYMYTDAEHHIPILDQVRPCLPHELLFTNQPSSRPCLTPTFCKSIAKEGKKKKKKGKSKNKKRANNNFFQKKKIRSMQRG